MGGAGMSRQRVRTTLLVAKVALAAILLVGSGLFISSFVRLLRRGSGVDLDNVLSVDLVSRKLADADMPRASATVTAVVEQVRPCPDRGGGTGLGNPAAGHRQRPHERHGSRSAHVRPARRSRGREIHHAGLLQRAARAPVRGRIFTDLDVAPGAPPSVILNDIAAARYFGAANPIGTRSSPRATASSRVVRSVRLLGPEADMRPEVYVPLNWQQRLGARS